MSGEIARPDLRQVNQHHEDAIVTSTETTTAHQFQAKYRFPHLSKRWKSVGTYATEAEATAALEEFLKGRTYRAIDRWIHRVSVGQADELEDAA